MTFRAILIGLLLAMGIAVFGYFNDWVMQQAFLTTNLIPICVYGVLVIALLVIRPLTRAIGSKVFSASEWCVVTALMLVACVVPGPGLMWYFSNTLVTPHYQYAQSPGWRKHEVINFVPKVMLADPGEKNVKTPFGADYQDVVTGFRAGNPEAGIRLGNVPWHAWSRTLTFWLPLIGLSFVAGICLVMVVHTQWSNRERLRYPIAYVTSEIIGGWAPAKEGGLFRNRIFWLGFAIPAVILLIKGYRAWNTQSIDIALNIPGLDSALGKQWPKLWNYGMSWLLLNPTLYFSALGFAFFVSSDISFSLGISGVIHCAVFLSLTVAGINVSGAGLEGGLYDFQMFGSYVGLALVIFYTGRKLYGSVLARSLFIPTSERVESQAVWALRMAMLAGVAMFLILVLAVGMDWLLAALFLLLAGMMFLVLTRINVETGLFMIQPGWYAVGILLGVFGLSAVGLHMLVVLSLLCMVITIDPLVCLMPLAANALKIGETGGINLSRLSRWMTVAVLLALVVGVVGTLTVQYTHGATRYGWADTTAVQPFELAATKMQSYTGDVPAEHGLQLALTSPNTKLLWALGIGLAVVLILSALRLRYTWWPIHPVLFLIWGTFPGMVLAPSFFLGWVMKTIVTTFGGGHSYRNSKPFFIGLIAGEFAAAIFWTIVGVAYYLVKHMPGPAFRILPA